jgi:hypothetical protein
MDDVIGARRVWTLIDMTDVFRVGNVAREDGSLAGVVAALTALAAGSAVMAPVVFVVVFGPAALIFLEPALVEAAAAVTEEIRAQK